MNIVAPTLKSVPQVASDSANAPEAIGQRRQQETNAFEWKKALKEVTDLGCDPNHEEKCELPSFDGEGDHWVHPKFFKEIILEFMETIDNTKPDFEGAALEISEHDPQATAKVAALSHIERSSFWLNNLSRIFEAYFSQVDNKKKVFPLELIRAHFEGYFEDAGFGERQDEICNFREMVEGIFLRIPGEIEQFWEEIETQKSVDQSELDGEDRKSIFTLSL
eukprot:g5765.t1